MIYTAFNTLNEPDSAVESMIRSIESAWSCRITIHDLLGLTRHQRRSGVLFNGRSMHTHSFCQWRRRSRTGWHTACNQHCLENMTREVLAGPGYHECWKGGREVTIPVLVKDQHLFTLFAGVFRGAPPEGGEEGSVWHQYWQALPEIGPRDMQDLAAQLQMLGRILLQGTQERHEEQPPRAQLIRTFIREHAHQPVGLSDLAGQLGISEGQCSREVKRLMSKPFRKLLIEERLKRAAILITNYDVSLETIAQQVGFSDQYHFSKSFKHHYGLAPGQWRRKTIEDVQASDGDLSSDPAE